MSLKSCPDCENQVSKRAKACPRCGCPIQKDEVKLGLFALDVATGPLGCLPFLTLVLCASLPFLYSG